MSDGWFVSMRQANAGCMAALDAQRFLESVE
jgi:hypothetical protein